VLLPLCNTAASALERPSDHEVSRLIVLKSTEFCERGGVLELPCGLAHSFPNAAGCEPLDYYTLCSALRSSASASAAEPLHMLASKSSYLDSVFMSYAQAMCYDGFDRFLDARSLFDKNSTKNNIFENVVLAAYITARK
jgi:hypothetical protein